MIYLCSSFKNKQLNEQIVEFLGANTDISIYSPQQDTPQDSLENIFNLNTEAIKNSKIILVILSNYYGLDLAWEVGYAYGLNKLVLGFYQSEPEEIVRDEMVNQSINKFIIGEEDLLLEINKFETLSK